MHSVGVLSLHGSYCASNQSTDSVTISVYYFTDKTLQVWKTKLRTKVFGHLWTNPLGIYLVSTHCTAVELSIWTHLVFVMDYMRHKCIFFFYSTPDISPRTVAKIHSCQILKDLVRFNAVLLYWLNNGPQNTLRVQDCKNCRMFFLFCLINKKTAKGILFFSFL